MHLLSEIVPGNLPSLTFAEDSLTPEKIAKNSYADEDTSNEEGGEERVSQVAGEVTTGYAKAQRPWHFRGKLVEVTVGDAVKEVFHIHDQFLYRGSLFFEAALRPEWREGRERAVKLPEEDPDVFCCYMQYLYTGYVSCTTETPAGYHKLVKLWVLADHLLAFTLQNLVIDCILAAAKEPHRNVQVTELEAGKEPSQSTIDPAEKHVIHSREKDCLLYLPSEETVEYVYQNTLQHSPLRRLMVVMYIKHARCNGLRWDDTVMHPDFTIDVAATRLASPVGASSAERTASQIITLLPSDAGTEVGELYKGRACRYHIHNKDERCP
ncbi:hypothetical protein LTR17_017859 [Elasticomyces elasticus]|nr:hypothetical protein LTR17_017859 [Elasticomyces elasticus]